MRHFLAAAVLMVACTPPPGGGGGADAGVAGDGGSGAGPIVAPLEAWTWVPVEGSRCASGSTAGLGVNLSAASDDLFIYLQGGGACWDQGTCVPSLLRYGPICYYNPNFCLYDGPGGTQPLSSHVTHPDPFPADGGGAFPGELALISSVRAFHRDDPDNPFRAATFVYVPYCTGDLHAGDAVKDFAYKYDAFGDEQQYTFHFAGAANMERYLERLAATRPNAGRIWITGTSAGGYGATFNFERVKKHFPEADVALLADSAPFIDTPGHWEAWRDAWNVQLPEGCADCGEGLSKVMTHLLETHADARLGLLSFDHDKVLSYYFFGATGPDAALSPPTGTYAEAHLALLAGYDDHPNAAYFVLPGEEHGMWGGYGTAKPGGGYTEARQSPDGATDLKAWIDAWAAGSEGWTSVR